MIGRVVSTKMAKTAVVIIESVKTHPLYKKSYIWSEKYLVDDPFSVKEGDLVEFVKTAPISKRKHWRITKVVGSDLVAIATEKLKESAQEAIAEVLPEETEEEEKVEVEVKEESKETKPKAKKAKKETK